MSYYHVSHCKDLMILHRFIKYINDYNYEIVAITEKNGYTVIYKK